jgi:GMP synthase (glutamine-hydrolysing)
MKPIAILQHNDEVPPGYLGDAIKDAGLPSRVVRLYAGDDLPALDEVSAIVSLGGIMGAYEEADFAFLATEKALLRSAVDNDIPVLGICLGCQILADALGGNAYPAGEHEVEFRALRVVAAAADDPVLGLLTQPVLSFHGDTWDVPPGASVLVTSDRYPHGFRMGSAVAVQSHPEASVAIAKGWVELYGREKLVAEGVDPDELIGAMELGSPQNASRAMQMFAAWLEEVVASG